MEENIKLGTVIFCLIVTFFSVTMAMICIAVSSRTEAENNVFLDKICSMEKDFYACKRNRI